jgi:hypothetical protein
VAGRIRSIEKLNDLTGNLTHDVLVCSIDYATHAHPANMTYVIKVIQGQNLISYGGERATSCSVVVYFKKSDIYNHFTRQMVHSSV